MHTEHTEETILNELIAIVEDMTSDWDLDGFDGGITRDTRLVADLSFESVEVVQLMVMIEQHFGIKNLASEKLLMRDGRNVPDLTLPEIARFLHGEMNAK